MNRRRLRHSEGREGLKNLDPSASPQDDGGTTHLRTPCFLPSLFTPAFGEQAPALYVNNPSCCQSPKVTKSLIAVFLEIIKILFPIKLTVRFEFSGYLKLREYKAPRHNIRLWVHLLQHKTIIKVIFGP